MMGNPGFSPFRLGHPTGISMVAHGFPIGGGVRAVLLILLFWYKFTSTRLRAGSVVAMTTDCRCSNTEDVAMSLKKRQLRRRRVTTQPQQWCVQLTASFNCCVVSNYSRTNIRSYGVFQLILGMLILPYYYYYYYYSRRW